MKFSDTQDLINKDYNYEANGFTIGDIYNDKNSNQWSGRILSYAIINKLNTIETLKLFGEYYQEVLDNPNADSHKNIRALMKYGIESAKFDNNKLLLQSK